MRVELQTAAGFVERRIGARNSLPVTTVAGFIDRSSFALVEHLYLARSSAIDRRPLARWLPAEVSEESLSGHVADEVQRRQLEVELRSAFDAEPLEDGVSHPAQDVVRNALRTNVNVLDWLKALSLDATRPTFAASVLRCLGREERVGTTTWRVELVGDALASEDVEIRDAAVQAAESWGGNAIVAVLESHAEPVPWLRSVIDGIILGKL